MAKIPFDIKYCPQIESGEYKVVIYMGNSPTEECPVDILKWDKVTCKGDDETQEEYAKRWATQLLELAMKELIHEFDPYGGHWRNGYNEGFKEGKAEALKNLQR